MDKLIAKLFKRNKNSKKNSNKSSASSTDEKSTDLGLSFEYFQNQFFIDCLVKIPWTSRDNQELIELCAGQITNDYQELQSLSEFKNNYSSNRSVSWYLRDCFLYKILNNSLASEDLRILFLFRRFLGDLMQQMTVNRSKNPIRVYRSQLMNIESLDHWISSVGRCVTINSFISATKSYQVAMTYLKNNSQPIPDTCERVLLEIDADPRINGTRPFIETSSFDSSQDINEVLFMFGSIFLINNIRISDQGFYVIEITLYTDSDIELKNAFDKLRKDYFNENFDILQYAEILCSFNRPNDAEYYVKSYLENLPPNHEDRICCFNLFGMINSERNDYEESIRWFKTGLDSPSTSTSTNSKLNIARIHENMADVYMKTNSTDLALKHQSEALKIKQICLSSKNLSIGSSFERLGLIYERMNDRHLALENFRQAKSIYKSSSSDDQEKLVFIENCIQRVS